MEVVYSNCCGLDIHKKRLTACVITPQGRQTRSFGTTTKEVLSLADWLTEKQVSHVAMESTGVYWKPVYNLLEEGFAVMVVNARHIKAVPGRKTDVKDAEWIADLLRHGLVKASFIPDRPQRELRELVRGRRQLIQNRSQVINRIQKLLEGANIKLASVASNVVGVSGLLMLRSMAKGERDPGMLAEMARGQLREKIPALKEALQGKMGEHQRFMLRSYLRQLDFLDAEIAALDQEVASRVTPFKETVQRLDQIPGVGPRNAEDMLAEIGTDMSQFPTAAHLASWGKVCPGNNESAGKHRPGHTGKGNRWLKAALTEAARAASRTKDTYLSAQYHRLAPRRGKKRANMAVSHSILVSIYHMLRDNSPYRELGGRYFDRRDSKAVIRRSVHRIQALGYRVTLEPA